MARVARVIAELEGIRGRDAHGKLRPEAVVEFARNPKTALHARFEWNNTAAAERYRVWQARQLISVLVTIVRNDKPAYRAYVSLARDRKTGGGYREIGVVLRSRPMFEELLAEALAELQRLQERFAMLKDLQPVWRALAVVKAKKQKRAA